MSTTNRKERVNKDEGWHNHWLSMRYKRQKPQYDTVVILINVCPLFLYEWIDTSLLATTHQCV